jgi:hypothetical protein
MHLVFAELKRPVKDRLGSYGLLGRFGPERLYPTLGTAISGYLEATGTPWVDWTDATALTTGASPVTGAHGHRLGAGDPGRAEGPEPAMSQAARPEGQGRRTRERRRAARSLSLWKR